MNQIQLCALFSVQEFKSLARGKSRYYGFDGELFVCDGASKLYGGFLLMRKVDDEDLRTAASGSSTPTAEVSSHYFELKGALFRCS